eukprot:gene818-864_t
MYIIQKQFIGAAAIGVVGAMALFEKHEADLLHSEAEVGEASLVQIALHGDGTHDSPTRDQGSFSRFETQSADLVDSRVRQQCSACRNPNSCVLICILFGVFAMAIAAMYLEPVTQFSGAATDGVHVLQTMSDEWKRSNQHVGEIRSDIAEAAKNLDEVNKSTKEMAQSLDDLVQSLDDIKRMIEDAQGRPDLDVILDSLQQKLEVIKPEKAEEISEFLNKTFPAQYEAAKERFAGKTNK